MSRTAAILAGVAAVLVIAGVALASVLTSGDDPPTAAEGDAMEVDAFDPDADGPGPGESAPAATFEMFDGTTASMADYEGRPVLVNFWASWCPPCVAEMPDLETAHQQFADEVAFLGINTQDGPEAAADLVDQTGVTYDLARDPDGELFQAFGVFGMPATFFVSPDGEITGRHTGIMTLEQILEFVESGLEQTEADS